MFFICSFIIHTTTVKTSIAPGSHCPSCNSARYQLGFTPMQTTQAIVCRIFNINQGMPSPKVNIRFSDKTSIELDYEKLIQFTFFKEHIKATTFYIELDGCKSSSLESLIRIKECDRTEPLKIINSYLDPDLINLHSFLEKVEFETSKKELLCSIYQILSTQPIDSEFIEALGQYLKGRCFDFKLDFFSKLIHFKDVKFDFEYFKVTIAKLAGSGDLLSKEFEYIPTFTLVLQAKQIIYTDYLFIKIKKIWNGTLDEILVQRQPKTTIVYLIYVDFYGIYDSYGSSSLAETLQKLIGGRINVDSLKNESLINSHLELTTNQAIHFI